MNGHELSDEQRAAVEHGSGPLLVLAGAGSGKTRVLVSRIAHLIDARGVSPASILAITFTRKAAHEMRARLIGLIGEEQASRVSMGTFHSTGARILREFGGILGTPGRFSVGDEHDASRRIRDAMKDRGIPRDLDDEKPRDFLDRIGAAKRFFAQHVAAAPPETADEASRMYREGTEELWEAFCEREDVPNRERMEDVYSAYLSRAFEDAVLDYEDLMTLTLVLLAVRPEVARMLQDRWQYILVDEYQDTDLTQDAILGLLTNRERNLTVVGDDDQAIYRWRHARVENILTFSDRYAPCTVVRLERNYRSTPEIVGAADAVLEDRPEVTRHEKNLESVLPSGEKIRVWVVSSPEIEALAVVRDIREGFRRGEIANLDEVLVLYRLNSVGATVEEAFRRERLPFRATGAAPFSSRVEVRDLLALTRFFANPRDSVSFERIIRNMVHGIGVQTILRVTQHASMFSRSLLDVCASGQEVEGVGPRIGPRLVDTAEIIRTAVALADQSSVADGLRYMVDATEYRTRLLADLAKYEEQDDEEAYLQQVERIANVDSFLRYIEDLESLLQLEEPSLDLGHGDIPSMKERVAEALAGMGMDVTDASAPDDSAEDPGEGRVRLMTIHGAKGLEAEHVYVLGLEERVFPTLLEDRAMAEPETKESREHLAEEARLFYVAATRAKQRLILTASRTRQIRGGREEPQMMSRFLRSLPQTLHLRESRGAGSN